MFVLFSSHIISFLFCFCFCFFVNLLRKSKLKFNCSLIAIEFVRYIVHIIDCIRYTYGIWYIKHK